MTSSKRNLPTIAEQMIAALIPAALPRPRPEPAPLPTLPASSSPWQESLPALDIARLDRSGRVSARSLLDALGWRPGHRLRIDVNHSTVLIRAEADGRHSIGARGDLALPVAVRQMCAINTGDMVVLAAEPAHDLLILHPAATVARLLADLHTHLTADRHDR
ncbi:hypothetical protein [Dactylosporangium matsuzakiense]|uniref:Uncharacterized protein n=1 Tax=Dactylosporangium matsuzakiense TaxID=53360 RepID=A0A9W6NMF8_9ACTN|nr:hypothetical protein [Dactylosporangium matsuzakiense]GLL02156.1 hypothetical protein GCM10017581_038980 [Dactylosporangium matsuzakiense]